LLNESTIIDSYELKENEASIETGWASGLYIPKWDFDKGKWIEGEDLSLIEAEIEKSLLFEERQSILYWMADTDYIPLKVMRGNWTVDDDRYIQYLKDYDMKKARKDEIESILNLEMG